MAENCHRKKFHIGMVENCHRKKISYRHGRELPQEKNFISAWPRTATGKKFHIGMAENCHLKKNHIAMAENCHRKKNFISAWPRTAIAYSHNLVPRRILTETRHLHRRSLRLPTRRKWAQSGYLCTTSSTAQAGADAGISWS